LRHPNIVRVIDFDVADDGTPYMVMEYLAGRTLGQRLRAGESMSPARVARIVEQIAHALDAAHRHGIVHRDLKPDNIILDVEGGRDVVKVIDFGISKAPGASFDESSDTIVGTPQFMAPEQAEGRNDDVDARTDQFALACIAYTLLTGAEPFKGTTAVAVLYQVIHEQPRPLAPQLGYACPHLEHTLLKALAKPQPARYPTILAFSTALTQALTKVDFEARPPTKVDFDARPPTKVDFRVGGSTEVGGLGPSKVDVRASKVEGGRTLVAAA
jgi:serine/threonine-protein kinase